MPLGAFRLNGLAKKLAAAITDWSGWDGSLDGNDGNFSTPNTHTAFGAIDNSYGIIAYREGNTGNSWARPLLKSGSSLSLGGSDWIALGLFNESNDTAVGTFVFSADKSFGYYCSGGRVTRLNSITSSGFSASNMITATLGDSQIGMRMTSSNVIQSFRSNNMIEGTVTGTSTISISQTTTTFSNLPAGTQCVSVSSISDTQHIRIQYNISTGAVSAWLCTAGNSTASQIGSTITDGTSFGYMVPGGRYKINDLKHNKALAFGFNNTTKQQRYYVATSTTFTAYSVAANTISNNISMDSLTTNAGTNVGTGCVSLDNNRFMIKHNGISQEIFWIFDSSTGTTQSYFKIGNGFEERTRSSIAPWNATTVFSGNWQTGRILRIS
jgi:hypothetical protein